MELKEILILVSFKECRNPMTKKYLDKQFFKSFTLDYGDLLFS